jgi:hypothetical protein
VRVVANTTTRILIPPLAGGMVSLNLFTGIIAFTGGGKGTSDSAAREAIELPHTGTVGPGSGEGIGHLFKYWDAKEKRLVQFRDKVILSAADVSTLNAMKERSASTLFSELNKAWMGEQLGFAYATKEKAINLEPHEYRLCLTTGIQPANACVILDDVDSGTPARYLWMPSSDPGRRGAVRPDDPGSWRGWSLANSIGNPDALDPAKLWPMGVCGTAIQAVDDAAVDRLDEVPTDLFNSHALLSRLKTAAALALLECRADAITEEDWQLAGVVHEVSDRTRQRVIDIRDESQRDGNRKRAEAKAHEAIVVDSRLAEHATQRVGRSIMRKLDHGQWVAHSKLRGSLSSRDRDYFDDAIAALITAGQAESRSAHTDRQDRQGIECRGVS